jgi:hypothetical protein
VTAVLTLVSFASAVTTPPRSGPSCVFEVCVGAPYTDIAPYFPRDYLWMLPASVWLLAFLAFAVCVHSAAPPSSRPLTLLGVCLASIAAGLIGIDYFIQLTVIQPSVLRGELDGISLFSQYNPHGVFIALEALGYLLIAAALACLSFAFPGRGGVERALRWIFRAAFAVALAALVGFTAAYGHDLEYRFEVAVISIDWLALLPGAALAAVHFRRRERASG